MSSVFDLQAEVDALEERKLDLSEKIRDINSQLASRNRTRPDGSRMGEHEFWQWRERAVFAQNAIISELADVKLNLRNAREDLNAARRAVACSVVTKADMRRLRNALRKAMEEGFELNNAEADAFDRLEEALGGGQPTEGR